MEVVIVAAGKGSRMFSARPKVLHTIGGKPMLQHVVDTAFNIGASQVHVVIGFGAEQIKDYFDELQLGQNINWLLQEEQLGTGHAVQQAVSSIDKENPNNAVLVLCGDVPLIRASTLNQLLENSDQSSVSLLTLATEHNQGFGRIVRDGENQVIAIVEEKDTSTEQKEITEVNSGIMAVPGARLAGWLERLDNSNEQAEYYLTDIVALAVQDLSLIHISEPTRRYAIADGGLGV